MSRGGKVRVLVALAMVLGNGLVAAPSALAGKRAQRFDHNAVIFVHGFEGSGSQFESQAMRLESLGQHQRLSGRHALVRIVYQLDVEADFTADVVEHLDGVVHVWRRFEHR